MGHLPTPRQASGATKTPNYDETFLLYCPSCESESSLHVLIHALYYLPQNFQLLFVDNARTQLAKIMTWADTNITDRIIFEETGSTEQKEAPFFNADALIYNDDDADEYDRVTTPHVKLTHSADRITGDDRHGFNVADDNAEALATALLKLARTTV